MNCVKQESCFLFGVGHVFYAISAIKEIPHTNRSLVLSEAFGALKGGLQQLMEVLHAPLFNACVICAFGPLVESDDGSRSRGLPNFTHGKG